MIFERGALYEISMVLSAKPTVGAFCVELQSEISSIIQSNIKLWNSIARCLVIQQKLRSTPMAKTYFESNALLVGNL